MMPCSDASRPMRANSASTAARLSGRNTRKPASSGSSPSPGDTVIAAVPVTAGLRKSTSEPGEGERDDAPDAGLRDVLRRDRATPRRRAEAPRCRGRTRSRTEGRTGCRCRRTAGTRELPAVGGDVEQLARSRPSRWRTRRWRRSTRMPIEMIDDDEREAEADRRAERVEPDEGDVEDDPPHPGLGSEIAR